MNRGTPPEGTHGDQFVSSVDAALTSSHAHHADAILDEESVEESVLEEVIDLLRRWKREIEPH